MMEGLATRARSFLSFGARGLSTSSWWALETPSFWKGAKRETCLLLAAVTVNAVVVVAVVVVVVVVVVVPFPYLRSFVEGCRARGSFCSLDHL